MREGEERGGVRVRFEIGGIRVGKESGVCEWRKRVGCESGVREWDASVVRECGVRVGVG